MHRNLRVGLHALVMSLLAAPPVAAQQGATITIEPAVGQLALSVEAGPSGVRARACAALPCDASSGVVIPIAAPFDRSTASARVTRVAIGAGRAAALVVVHDVASGEHWVSVVVAPLAGGAATPHVVFGDRADVNGDPHATEPNAVQVATEGEGQVLVGTRHADFSLCGRPAMLGPRVLDPSDLMLKAVKLQRLDRGERDRASTLAAVRRDAPKPPPLARMLSAEGASSALGSPAALVDGDGETTWSEARGGDGKGEFVVLRAPREAPIVSLAFAVRPATRDIEHGASPKHLWVAADEGALYRVALPEDAWKRPGAVYDVTLPAPLVTSCVAIVLDDAYASKTPDADAVTLAEVEARADVDGSADLSSLVAALGGTDALAVEAAALLLRGGPRARAAVSAGYVTLNDRGRVRALDVIDQAPCEEAAPLYARALAGSFEGETIHARTRLERCRRKAAPALEAAALDPAHPARVQAALVLATAAPERALEALVHRPDETAGPTQNGLRRAIGRAASSSQSIDTLGRLLDDATLPAARTLELARVAGPALATSEVAPHAMHAITRVAPDDAPFSTRYLAVAPVAAIATSGNVEASGRLQRALGDADGRVRTEAARASGAVPSVRPRLHALAADAEPRVREAVARALAEADEAAGRVVLSQLLNDEWAFVRGAAARSLGRASHDPAADSALLGALARERVPDAQVSEIDALSARHALGAGDALRGIARDEARALEVRVHAVQGLGGVCHYEAVGFLDGLVRRGLTPGADAGDYALADAALRSLGRLHPRDLATRLAPYQAKGVPRTVVMAVRSALEERDTCAPRS